MSWRLRVATAFGRHSRRVWRCIIGASWSLPLRYVTLVGQLAAVAAVTGAGFAASRPQAASIESATQASTAPVRRRRSGQMLI
jgi:hypothetical protein